MYIPTDLTKEKEREQFKLKIQKISLFRATCSLFRAPNVEKLVLVIWISSKCLLAMSFAVRVVIASYFIVGQYDRK